MYTFIITILAFILAIVILVAVHEFGHFIVARINNVKVLKFSLGFGPALIKKRDKYGTEFILAPIPLGGYVKMLDKREVDVMPADMKYEFTSKTPMQKIAIVLAGPLFNFILAFMAFYFMYINGVNVERPVIYQIEAGSLAEKSGLKASEVIISVDQTEVKSFSDLQVALANRLGTSGELLLETKSNSNNGVSNFVKNSYKLILDNWQADINKEPVSNSLGIIFFPKEGAPLLVNKIIDSNSKLGDLRMGDIITSFNGKKIDNWDIFLQDIKANPNVNYILDILRNGVTQQIEITTGNKLEDNKQVGQLGVVFTFPIYRDSVSYGIYDSIYMAVKKTFNYISQTLYMLYKLVVGQIGVETVRGPIMVAKVAGIQMQLGLSNFLDFLGIISIGLGVINLLPIPVLDGGHVVYHLYEWVSGRRFSEFSEKIFALVGGIVLLLIMSVAFYNDFTYW